MVCRHEEETLRDFRAIAGMPASAYLKRQANAVDSGFAAEIRHSYKTAGARRVSVRHERRQRRRHHRNLGKRMSLVGRAFTYRYESGLLLEGRFLPGDRLAWKGLAGSAAGRSGTEQAHIKTVRPDLYFVSWVEASGVAVSQLLDLDQHRVFSFVSFETPAGRRGESAEGILEPLA